MSVRLTQLSFYYPGPLPRALLLADRIRVTLFADLDSFACSTAAPGGTVTAHVSPASARDDVRVTVSPAPAPPPPPHPPPASTSAPSPARTDPAPPLPLAALTPTPTPTPSSTRPARPPLPAAAQPHAQALARLAADPATRALVHRVRDAHVRALEGRGGGATLRRGGAGGGGGGAGRGVGGGGGARRAEEERVVSALAHALQLDDACRAARRSGAVTGARCERDGDERCLPGLGWVLCVNTRASATVGSEKAGSRGGEGEGEGEGAEGRRRWRVLFADGEEVVLSLRSHRQLRDGASEVHEAEEWVELRWRGGRCVGVPHPLIHSPQTRTAP